MKENETAHRGKQNNSEDQSTGTGIELYGAENEKGHKKRKEGEELWLEE